MNKKNWLIASLAVFVLALAIAIAIATSTAYLFVGVAILFALFVTYFAGRLDKPGNDAGGDI